MGLLAALLELQKLEESLQLPGEVCQLLQLPGPQAVKRAYLVAPPRGKNLTDLPCFLNWPDAAQDAGGIGRETQESIYSVQVDFYAKDAPSALAYFDVAWNAFRDQRKADRRLNGTVDFLVSRAERPLLETLEWNGVSHPGFHIFLDLTVFEAIT
jgi:hypothetical protein